MRKPSLGFLVVLAAGCNFSVDYRSGALKCGANHLCPDGLVCDLGADTCVAPGTTMNDGDAGMTGGTCSPASSTVCDGRGHLVICGADGHISSDVACSLGCSTGTPNTCAQMDVSNGLDRFVAPAAQGTDMVFPLGTSYINAMTGAVTINNAAVSVPSEVVNGMRVFVFKSLVINGVVHTQQTSDFLGPAIVFIVAGDVGIHDLLDLSANTWRGGPGALDVMPATDADCIGGRGGFDNTLASHKGGGGGGGGYSAGAVGGASSQFPGGTAGKAQFDDTLVPLRGGCPGGEDGAGFYDAPGGGGGAIQISSATKIEITGFGKIDASGGGGAGIPQQNSTAAGGGGGGGAILLEAPTVTLDGADVVLSTKGGAGGGTGMNVDGTAIAIGEDGGTGAAPAQGGYQTTPGGFLHGGNGGTHVVAPTAGSSPPSGTAGAGSGGGGGGGQVRFNTSDGNVTIRNGANVYSKTATGMVARH
jgi:hypothetical protein